MNKKNILIIGVLMILVAVCGSIWLTCKLEKIEQTTYDALKFKSEYENHNGLTNTSNNKKYLEISLENNNLIKYSSYNEIFQILGSGSGVIYFGFPTCPWCRNLVPTLLASASKAKIDKIYYLNILEDRDLKELNNKGKVVTIKEGSKDYQELVKILYDFLPDYSGLEDTSIKRIYMPTVVFVKDGKIIGLEQSLKTFQERVDGDPYLPMNKAEKKELAAIFNNYYKEINKK